jgi:hypothetical protein
MPGNGSICRRAGGTPQLAEHAGKNVIGVVLTGMGAAALPAAVVRCNL